jgi:hypothetical protein
MHLDWIEGGAVRVLISEQELKLFGTDFQSLKENDARSKIIIRRILRVVGKRAGLTVGTAMTVEAAPVKDGCLLLITPRYTPKQDDVYIFQTEDTEKLVSLLQAAEKWQKPLSPAVYRDKNKFFLVAREKDPLQVAPLGEFVSLSAKGNIAAALVAEHTDFLGVGKQAIPLIHAN